ncbi:MAG: rhomboid family intramembrane serine protease [Prosthecobacter sp.]
MGAHIARMALHDRDYMRESTSREPWGGITAFQVLLGLNALVFVMQFVFEIGWLRDPLRDRLIMPLGGVSAHELGLGHVWTLFTYMFVHGSVGHFFLNMMMLWFTGRGVQQLFGGLHLTLIYLFSGIIGAAAEMMVNGYAYGDTLTPLIGASASAFGLLTALAVAMPEEQITAFIYFIIPVRMRLWTLAKALCLMQLVLGLMCVVFDFMPEGLKIAYFAHLGGAAAGWFYARSLGYGGRRMTYSSRWQPDSAPSRRRPEMARARARQVIDLENDEHGAEPPPARADDPVASLMEKVVNPLLDKMNLHGKDSLTEEEKRLLERASAEVTRHRRRG